MGFLSPLYFLFFPLTVLVYFLLPHKARSVWLLACSWVFYLCAGPEYFIFLFGTILLTWLAALSLGKAPRKGLLTAAILFFVGMLFLFKYLAFAASLISRILASVGLDWSPAVPQLLMPAGISFYLFAAMGYLIDVYRGKTKAQRSFVRCALFLSFFPALLSGPIGRADKLIPQFDSLHKFSYVNLKEGFFRFLWGACKKLILADRLAVLVDTIFASPGEYGMLQVIGAACAFSLQIYCDFSAYSDMAVGSATAMGFELIENFRTPYFSRSIAEFWRRWHISLSSWFRDYLYIPLGGSRRGTARKYLNLLIVFAVSGLWHGAALSFLVWGLINGLYQVAGSLTAPLREKVRTALHVKEDSRLLALWQMGWVFVLSTLAWVFFKSGSISASLAVLKNMVTGPRWVLLSMGLDRKDLLVTAVSFLVLLAVDAWSTVTEPVRRVVEAPRWVRWCVLLVLLFAVLIFGRYGAAYDAQSFIYARF